MLRTLLPLTMRHFRLRSLPGAPGRAWLHAAGGAARGWPVIIGRRGVAHVPGEGDMATPSGILRPVAVLYRADRVKRPQTQLMLRPIRPDDGWCDAPDHPLYNRFVRHPFATSAERLWRHDHAYDLLVVLDFNLRPRAGGRGSAIFLHLMHDDRRPTAGCISMAPAHLRQLVEELVPGSGIVVD